MQFGRGGIGCCFSWTLGPFLPSAPNQLARGRSYPPCIPFHSCFVGDPGLAFLFETKPSRTFGWASLLFSDVGFSFPSIFWHSFPRKIQPFFFASRQIHTRFSFCLSAVR